MKLFTRLDEIPELKKESVHIKNEDQLLKKLNKILQDGHRNLQIVTDFDYTLTRHSMDDGRTVLTSFGMFRECPSVPQHYKDEENRLSAIYKPIECDPHISSEEKKKHMTEWYITARALLKGLKFPRRELTEMAKSVVECFRTGVDDLISWSDAKNVPVLVFSAGLGEAVVATLEVAGLLRTNIKVVSNFLAMDEDDKIIGIKGEIIHTYNKNQTAIKNTEYYQMVKDRSNVILIGDSTGDANMAEGMDHCDVVLRIGFLGRNIEGNLNSFMDTFDIVLVNDSTMDVVNAILKLL